MIRHLCLLAAAAAPTTQNATRQLDAYEPPPTDLSRACASWRPDRDGIDRVRTIRAGNFVNLAHATGGAFVASVSKVRRPPKGQNCRVLYELEVIVAACGTPSQKASVAIVPSHRPTRKCMDVRNWRANGPEDARIVARDHTHTTATFYIFYNDWGKHRKLWSRRQFVVPITVSDLREPRVEVGQHVRRRRPVISLRVRSRRRRRRTIDRHRSTRGDGVERRPRELMRRRGRKRPGAHASQPRAIDAAGGCTGPTVKTQVEIRYPRVEAGSTKLTMEKNWAPFVIGDHLFAHRWLDDPSGDSQVLEIDARNGNVVNSSVCPGAGAALRSALGLTDADYTVKLSGGTNAERLEDGSYVGIGHSMRDFGSDRRVYAMFGYVFDGYAPFCLRKATDEFHFAVPHGTTLFTGDEYIDAKAVVPRPNDPGRHSEGIQFPMSLVLEGSSSQVMFGYTDRISHIGVIDTAELIATARPLKYGRMTTSEGFCGKAEDPPSFGEGPAPQTCSTTSANVHLGCSERYFTIIECGGAHYLFSRGEVVHPDKVHSGLVRVYEQRVRVSTSGKHGPYSSPARVFPQDRTEKYGVVENTAYTCQHGDKLVAYGGLGSPRATKLKSDGIWRRSTTLNKQIKQSSKKDKPLPPSLKWRSDWSRAASPRVEVSGCVESLRFMARWRRCLFDGKLSVVQRRHDDWLLYGRANKCARGGRGVQVTRSTDQGRTFGRFHLVTFKGSEVARSDDNAYFLVASKIPESFFNSQNLEGIGPWVFGCFPGVKNGREGGVFCAPSVDGVTFGTPLPIVRSHPEYNWRTRDHVVDIDVFTSEGVSVLVHCGVNVPNTAIEENPEQEPYERMKKRLHKNKCRNDGYCENCYKAPVASSLCRRTYAAHATKLDDGIELKLVPEDPDDGIGGGVIRWVLNDLGTGKHAPPIAKVVKVDQSQPVDASLLTRDVRSYLQAVYPSSNFDSIDDHKLRTLYESLDYFYDCRPERLAPLMPRVSCGFGIPKFPYVPPGVYFSARDARVDDVTRDALRWGVSGGVNSDDRLPASFTRWRSMLRRVRTPDMRDDLLATFGARRGPAPIGTNAAALVKYPLYPLGLHPDTLQNDIIRRPHNPLDGLWDVPERRKKFSHIKTGDYLEVEQFGGPDWIASGFPATTFGQAGLRANIWKGTGVGLRVVSPFVSRSKASAIAEMLTAVSRRGGDEYIDSIATLAGFSADHFSGGDKATELAVVLLSTSIPCDVEGLKKISMRWRKWRNETIHAGRPRYAPPGTGGSKANVKFRFVREPSLSFSELTLAKHSMNNASLGLHWLHSACSSSPYYTSQENKRCVISAKRRRPGQVQRFCRRRWLAWDNLLMVLSCALGVKTLILDAQPNDNGLFHEVLMDYDVPNGWPTLEDNTLNPLDTCMQPFDDGRSAPHRTDVIRYWRESRKFGVVDPLTGTTSECDLTGDATKMIAARFEAETGRPKPRGYVACRGALSEAFMDGALATHLPWSGLQAA